MRNMYLMLNTVPSHFSFKKSKKLHFGRQVFASFNATLAAIHIKCLNKKGLLMSHPYLPFIFVPFSMEKEIGILYSYLSTFRDNVTLFARFFSDGFPNRIILHCASKEFQCLFLFLGIKIYSSFIMNQKVIKVKL